MKTSLKISIVFLIIIITKPIQLFAQEIEENNTIIEKLKKDNENLGHRLDVIQKKVDDIIWHQRVGEVAFIDKVYLAGPPRWKIKDTTAQGAKNPLKFWSYIFIPKGIDFSKKYPLIVFPHGGVHSNFSTYYTHIVKELLAQQYIIVAAEYLRSSFYSSCRRNLLFLHFQDLHQLY